MIYDVYCKTVDGNQHFILEMQQEHHLNLENRIMYYMARALERQGKKGSNYEFSPVYGIFFVDFQFMHLSKRLIQDFTMREKETYEPFSDLLRILIVSLGEVKEKWEDCASEFEQITYLIKNMHKMDTNSKEYKSSEFDEMFEASKMDNLAAEEMVSYNESLKAYEDRVLYYQSAFEKGESKGRLEEKKETARKMKMAGFDDRDIKMLTDLAPGEY